MHGEGYTQPYLFTALLTIDMKCLHMSLYFSDCNKSQLKATTDLKPYSWLRQNKLCDLMEPLHDNVSFNMAHWTPIHETA